MELNENDATELATVLIGRRIVEAEMGKFDYPGRADDYSREYAEGRLVLDDGTTLYLTGHDGGCGCSAGCYPLERVATMDNVITDVKIECNPSGDDYTDGEGVYRIFVYAEGIGTPVAEFVGSDGNGYYGTGFAVHVAPARKEL